LLKQLKDIVSGLVFDGSQKQRSEHTVVNLDILSIACQNNEPLRILFKTLASLKEKNKFLEG